MEQTKRVAKQELNIVGIAVKTSNEREASGDGVIPKLWHTFFSENISEQIPNKVEESPLYGVYTDYENGASGTYTMIVGVEVSQFDELPHGLVKVTIPAATYTVFTSEKGAIAEIVPRTWQRIWNTNLERSFTTDFELYDERSANPEQAQIDIYIATKNRKE